MVISCFHCYLFGYRCIARSLHLRRPSPLVTSIYTATGALPALSILLIRSPPSTTIYPTTGALTALFLSRTHIPVVTAKYTATGALPARYLLRTRISRFHRYLNGYRCSARSPPLSDAHLPIPLPPTRLQVLRPLSTSLGCASPLSIAIHMATGALSAL